MDRTAGQRQVCGKKTRVAEFASLSFLRVNERGPRGSLRGTVEYFKHAGGPLGEKWPCAP
jgi:hypothetical protein